MNLFRIFYKNWKPVFCFFGGFNEIIASLVFINTDNKKLKIKKYYQIINNDEDGFGEKDIIDALAHLIKKISKKVPLLLCFEQPFAKSTKARFSVVRDNPLSPIDKEELENAILNLAWRLYDKERIFVSQKLKISEWDVVLADSKISDPRIDDRKVLNPIGFSGKSLSFCLENTYLNYLFWENIKDVLERWGGELIFCAEKNLIFDKISSLIEGKERIAFVEITSRSTSAAVLGNYLNSYRSFDWGSINLIKSLSQRLGISLEQAEELKTIYSQGALSEAAHEWFKKLFEKELRLLAQGINLAFKDMGLNEKISHIYLTGDLAELPDLIPFLENQKWNAAIFVDPPKIQFYDALQLMKDLNLELIDFNEKKLSINFVINLAAIFLGDNKYQAMNKILKRRIKWLNQNLLKKR